MRPLIVTLWLTVAALIQPTASARAEILLGVATVIDGATLEIRGQKEGTLTHSVRGAGLDAKTAPQGVTIAREFTP